MEWQKYDDSPLDVIASDMLDWCLTQGCQKLGENNKEYRVQCPNINCPSRQKSESHKAFDINKDTAKYHCQHCQLSGQGLHGERGLIANLERGEFSFSASSGVSKINVDTKYFKPKEKTEIKPCIDRQQYSSLYRKYRLRSETAKAYLKKRGILSEIESDMEYYHICAAPKGTKIPFLDEPLNNEVIIFPTRKSINNTLEVVHFQYRYVVGGKWYNPTGVSKRMWWTKQHSEIIVMTEGIPDALSVAVAGYTGCALLGTEITADYDLEPFRDKIIVILLDGDKEGLDATKKIASNLVDMGIASEVRIGIISPEIDGIKVKDPNDVLVKCGAEKLNEIIENATPYDDWLKQSEKIEDTSMESEQDTSDNKTKSGVFAKLNSAISNNEIKPEPTQAQDVKSETAEVLPKEQKPKGKAGIIFPDEAWRGIFETYRQAQEGTTEAPEQYHFAVIKTVTGIIVGRTAYVQSGRKLYPNFYTVLIGPTTRSRKSTAANRGTSLLADIDEEGKSVGADPLVLTLRGLSTPSGLLAQLKGQNTDDEGLSQVEYDRAMSTSPYEGYRALIVINEFASLLRQAKKEHGSGLIQLLTDAYDCFNELHNPTKVDPIVAKNAVISMLCLSTQEWLENTLDIADVYGGYACRNLFYEWTQTEPVPDPDEASQTLLNEVTIKLQGIRKAYEERGKQQLKYQFSTEAKPILKDWYVERYYQEYPSEVIASATQRIDENVRKLALLYAVLENDDGDLSIHANQLKTAITVGEYWEQTATRLFGKFGFTKDARTERRIVEVLERNDYTKRDLQQHFGGSMSAKEFNQTIKSLLESERIRWIPDKSNKRKKLLTIS